MHFECKLVSWDAGGPGACVRMLGSGALVTLCLRVWVETGQALRHPEGMCCPILPSGLKDFLVFSPSALPTPTAPG